MSRIPNPALPNVERVLSPPEVEHAARSRRRVLIAALLVPLALVACGRKGRIGRPEDADPQAPRTYPTQ